MTKVLKNSQNGQSELMELTNTTKSFSELSKEVIAKGDELPMLTSGLTEMDKILLQSQLGKLNKLPDASELDKTPDGRASVLPISFIEMTLDEIFFGQWSTSNFHFQAMANEIVGSIELTVIDPVTGREIKRTGAASIQIMVDKAPENISGTEKNKWALNLENKKSNALDMGFPKLKAECTKNAAQSLGKVFGRDLNRKKADVYKPALQRLGDDYFTLAVNRIMQGEIGLKETILNNFLLTDEQKTTLSNLKVEQQKTIANG